MYNKFLFCFALLYLLNISELFSINPATKCDKSCERCDQMDDPNSCTSCSADKFKLSLHYDSDTFECISECIGRQPKDLPHRDYKWCPKVSLNRTTTSATTATSTTTKEDMSKDHQIFAADPQMIMYIFFITINIAIIFLLISCFACVLYYIIHTRKVKNKKIRINESENLPILPMNNPVKLVKENEKQHVQQQQLPVVYNNLRNVDVSDFAKGESIGGGNYSRVYEGKLDGEPIAIKVALKEGRKSIHKELQIYDNIQHPNILQALGFHLAVEDLLFLPLRQFNLSQYFMSYSSVIESSKLLHYCIQVTDAMKYLHKNNIIHCDLKIDNILVKDDKGEEIEISDFGCAIDLTCDHTSRFNGTRTHMAYELLKSMYLSQQNFRGTKATDVWAYAITMWQIFSKTCLLPDDYVKSEQIIENYEKGKKLPKPQEMSERMWRYVFLQCFDLEPSGRPSMNEIYERITSQLSSSSTSTKKEIKLKETTLENAAENLGRPRAEKFILR